MVTSTIHSPSNLEFTKMVISQDELHALLVQVESEFCQSEIYQRAVGGLQKRLDQASVNVQLLIQALGREAIRLALRQVVQQGREPDRDADSPSSLQTTNSETIHSGTAYSRTVHAGTATPQPTAQTASQDSIPQSLPEDTQPEADKASFPKQASAAISTPADSILPRRPRITFPSDVQAAEQQRTRDRQPDQVPQTTSRQPIRVSGRLSNSSAEDKSPNQAARSEALKQIGQQLQQARTRKSWSIYDIHQRTRVPLHQIQSLELGQIDQLPEDIYVRGFIRRIAEVVDLNSVALLEMLPYPSNKAHFSPTWQSSTQSTPGPELKTKAVKPPRHLRPRHLYLGYAVLMTGAAGGLAWMSQQPMDGFDLESLNLDVLPDIPELIHNLAPIQILKYEMQKHSQDHAQPATQGTIAQPETIPVESSTDSQPQSGF